MNTLILAALPNNIYSQHHSQKILLIWNYFLYLKPSSVLFNTEQKPKFIPRLTRPFVPTASLTYYSLTALFVHACCPANSPTCLAPSLGLGVCPSIWNTLPSNIHMATLPAFACLCSNVTLSVKPSLIALLKTVISFPPHHPSPAFAVLLFSLVFVPSDVCFTYLFIVRLPAARRNLHEHRDFYQLCSLLYLQHLQQV